METEHSRNFLFVKLYVFSQSQTIIYILKTFEKLIYNNRKISINYEKDIDNRVDNPTTIGSDYRRLIFFSVYDGR